MGKLRRNDSKSFQHVQDRFTCEAGKFFDEEHQGCKCPNAVFIRVLFCAFCHVKVQSSGFRVQIAKWKKSWHFSGIFVALAGLSPHSVRNASLGRKHDPEKSLPASLRDATPTSVAGGKTPCVTSATSLASAITGDAFLLHRRAFP